MGKNLIKGIIIALITLQCLLLYIAIKPNFIKSQIFSADNKQKENAQPQEKTADKESDPEESPLFKLPLEEKEKLNFSSILGTGKTSFAGSSKNRIANIQIGSSKINGIIVYPQKEFSALDAIGEVSAEEGYKPEANIIGGKTVMALGGGLCQASTTIFRAALNAGMKITQRKNHAYAVGYYSPQGTDAAIARPSLDFKFINTSDFPVLIQSRVENLCLIVDIFGIKNGEEIKIKGPFITSRKGGVLKTALYQEIYNGGILTRKDAFYSAYRPHSDFPKEE